MATDNGQGARQPETLVKMADKVAYDTLQRFQPSLLVVLGKLLDKGETPEQIAAHVQPHSAFLAGITEMAASYMRERNIRPPRSASSAAN